MCRYVYALKQLIAHRQQLAEYANNAALQSRTIFDISPQQLYDQGIRVLIVDFDGVLAAHAAPTPTAAAEQWLSDCLQCFGEDRVFILSNNPIAVRQKYFAGELAPACARVVNKANNIADTGSKDSEVVYDTRINPEANSRRKQILRPKLLLTKHKKPYPEGILAIKEHVGCALHEILLVDDRLVTGILAAIIAGIKAVYIVAPMVDVKKNPCRELFFMVLRKIEFLYAR